MRTNSPVSAMRARALGRAASSSMTSNAPTLSFPDTGNVGEVRGGACKCLSRRRFLIGAGDHTLIDMDMAVNTARQDGGSDRPLLLAWWQRPLWRRSRARGAGVAAARDCSGDAARAGTAQPAHGPHCRQHRNRGAGSLPRLHSAARRSRAARHGVPGMRSKVASCPACWCRPAIASSPGSRCWISATPHWNWKCLIAKAAWCSPLTQLQTFETQLEQNRAGNERLLSDAEYDAHPPATRAATGVRS